MDADAIIQTFATTGKTLPVEAMLACRDDWETVAPALLGVLTRYVDGEDCSEPAENALFFILHMLGERGETRAFAPLCRFAHDAEAIEEILGDGITVTFAGMLIGTYDGTLLPLQQLIEDPEIDEIVRSEALNAMAFLAASDRIARDVMAVYLRQLHDSLLPKESSFVWFSWALVIVLLRLETLEALIEGAYARGLIPLEICDEAGFRDIRDQALRDTDMLASFRREQIRPLDDAIVELSRWATFSGAEDSDDDATDDDDLSRYDPFEDGPAVNPYRDVGRNDPCPCGSGKKFKKCCLGAAPA